MNNLNSVLLEGNLVRDAEVITTPKGTSVCNFCIASNRYYKGDTGFEREVSFFIVTTWGKLADSCGRIGKKGRGVRVVGRLKQDRWTDTDGKSRNKVYIIAEHVDFRPEFKKKETVRDVLSDEEELEVNNYLDSEGAIDIEDEPTQESFDYQF